MNTTAPKHPVDAFRVQFVYDYDAQFEESNGEARPLTKAEYKNNVYLGCPVHPRSSERANVTNGHADCGECGLPYADIPYDEYLAYYGNPERHVYLGCIVETRCTCCGMWKRAASLWGIDVMDDDLELASLPIGDNNFTYPLTPGRVLNDPDASYLAGVARELLTEAGYPNL